MATEKDNGGPAFPAYWKDSAAFGQDFCQEGMTLRDYFAAKALGMLADPRTLSALRDEARATGKAESVLMAAAIYEVADAMLAERAK